MHQPEPAMTQAQAGGCKVQAEGANRCLSNADLLQAQQYSLIAEANDGNQECMRIAQRP